MVLKPPSRVEKVTFPVLGFAWWSDPSNGRSVSAYCGGGGRSRTGVPNLITIQDGDNDDKRHVSTGDEVGEICKIAHNPVTNKLWLFVSFTTKVRRYAMPSGELDSVLPLDEGDVITAMAVSAASTLLAVGLETGVVKLFHITDDDDFASAKCIGQKTNHTMAVSGIDFSIRGGRVITGSKDGTACVYEREGILTAFRCSIDDPAAEASKSTTTSKTASNAKGKAPPRALVRACLFLDVDGRVAITVASAVRGRSFLSRWEDRGAPPPANDDAADAAGAVFECVDRTAVAPHPISAINLSLDGMWLAWGTASGAVTLWNVVDWKKLHEWPEVHDFSVTAIAARPYPGVPLQGEDDGLQVHVRTVSADLTIGYLTMMRRIPRPARSYGQQSSLSVASVIGTLQWLLTLGVIGFILLPVVREANYKCGYNWRCIRDEVLIAPPDRPGISTPPY
jgi:WD40 repeat protein